MRGMSMDHQELDDHQVPERYLRGQLTPEETDRFEDHLLECPECVERLELAERFQVALRGVVAEDAARAGVGAGIIAALVGGGRRRGLAWLLTIALIAAAALPSGVLLRRINRLDDERARLEEDLRLATAPRLAPSVLRLGPQRGAVGAGGAAGAGGPTHRITLTEQPEWIVLLLELEAETEARTCLVDLEGPDGSVLLKSGPIDRGVDGNVVLTLHSSTLKPGDHLLGLACSTADGPDPRLPFSFRVIR